MVQIRQMLLSPTKYSLKSPYSMTPKFITIHNTANDAPAVNEANYHNSNNNQVSFHYAVDDKEAIQVLPDNRNGWHCGDGQGNGNRKSIGIEICYSKSGGARYTKAESNAVELTAHLLKKHNLPVSAVKQHYDWSKKNCPHRIRANGTWKDFLNRVQKELDKLNGKNGTNVLTPEKGHNGTSVPNKYRIKSGAFKSKAQAENAKAQVAKHGIASATYISILSDGGVFRFQTGSYPSETQAQNALQKMKNLKILSVGYVIKA